MKISIKEDIINDENLKHQEIYLFLHLINLANKDGEIIISNKELMRKTRFTNGTTIIKYIDNLVLNGYISRISGGGAGHKNSYKINKDYLF